MKVVVGILAGGVGKRVGADVPKQFLKVSGVPILIRSIRKFLKFPVVVSMKSEWVDYARKILKEYNLDGVELVEGGETRQISSYNATKFFKEFSPDAIIIHDAARCMVSEELISNLVLEMESRWNNVDGIVPYVPVTDSLIELGNGVRYLKREKIGRVQTPQIFKFEKLLDAHRHFFEIGEHNFTDEGSMVVKIDGKIFAILGEISNIKISTLLDIQIAENLVVDEK